ncbi:secretory lipase, putative [Cordyceps militaris CM01]|uniref:Secretory lipase, putative n=1 Tax=Cordyceps militaris (strain CM01) TaxID=983644 RepID=G3JBI5_CORMM|nr:secretory lipase, putative [Cordyceps militaris CM01]EGX95290.1 secretory lipase, putative [Cordyceps militaris CM01]
MLYLKLALISGLFAAQTHALGPTRAKSSVAKPGLLPPTKFDTFGNAIATVTTVLVPHNATNTNLLSYQVAEDAANPNCCPSYVFQQGSETGGPGGDILALTEVEIIKSAVEMNWYITIPDYLGPKAAFLANTLAGHAVLDGIRATLASSSFTGLAQDPLITMWGYSSGSFGSGFAAELQPTYAPELKIIGAVLGGPVASILSVLSAVHKSVYAGLIAVGILGLGNEYPEAASLIEDQVLPEKKAKVDGVRSLCIGAVFAEFLFEDVFTYCKDPSIFNSTFVAELMAANDLGQHTPRIPMLVYKAIDDEVSAVADSDKLVQSYCDSGASLEYRRIASSSHLDLYTSGAPMAIAWIKDRFNGVAVPQGCVQK